MKKLLLLSFMLLSLSVSAQHYIEATISNQDKAFGINYMNLNVFNLDVGLALGAESGLYKDYNFEIEHQRYKLGFAKIFVDIYNSKSDIIVNLSACYNDYHVRFKDEDMKKLKKFSIDAAIRTNLTDNIFIGFNYDIILQQGGLSVGFLIN